MSLDELRTLAMGFSREVVKRLGPKIYALWISGSVARGDFMFGVSDLDLELILKESERKIRTTDDMNELREVTRTFRERALSLGASEFHCFVFQVDDLDENLHTYDLACNAQTLFGKTPQEVFDIEKMKRESKELALNTIRKSARYAKNALEGKSPHGIERSVELVMETDHTPAPLWEALVVVKAANFATGEREWMKPKHIKVFGERFPEDKPFVNELWQYRIDQTKLRSKGEEYTRDFMERCLRFIIDINKKYGG